PLLHLSEIQYGVLAGMTVYAVPQVLAATMPAGLVSTHIGTLVKLIRVMMVGPVVACIAVFARSLRGDGSSGVVAPISFFDFVSSAFAWSATLRRSDAFSATIRAHQRAIDRGGRCSGRRVRDR